MSAFAQPLRQAQILVLEILNVFLWLKRSPSLTLNKIERFETASAVFRYSDGHNSSQDDHPVHETV